MENRIRIRNILVKRFPHAKGIRVRTNEFITLSENRVHSADGSAFICQIVEVGDYGYFVRHCDRGSVESFVFEEVEEEGHVCRFEQRETPFQVQMLETC